MVIQILVILVIVLYTISLTFILCFSFTQAHLVFNYLFYKKKYKAEQEPSKFFESLPFITVQLPVYNEKYVAERLIDCIVNLDYPAGKFEIQVLDDSTDETTGIIAKKVSQLKGIVNIKHLHRTNRAGYKAGALKEGLTKASGELIAIFDADFLPGKNFLLKTVPHFANDSVGMVQTKWGWLNKTYSLLTRVQAFALDAHFSIEQVGRNIHNGFINFNGTAGVWRKSCILDAGNWQADTLTEDLDLSYRAQLKGWKFVYLEEVNSPSELPPVISAVKTQQYRWNKGGAETARKHLGKVIFSGKPFLIKLHGIMHLLTSGIFLSALICTVLSVPMLLIRQFYPAYANMFIITNYFFLSFLILGIVYLLATTLQYKNKWKGMAVFLKTMPAFLALSMGLSLHNGLAVLEGYWGKKTPFIRTPKFNVVGHQDTWSGNQYLKKGFNRLIIAEAGLIFYFATAIVLAFKFNDFAFIAFHILLVLGYGAIVYYTLFQRFMKTSQQTIKPASNRRVKKEDPKLSHKMSGVAVTLGISLLTSCGQQLNEGSYNLMLRGLLNHSVPEISVAEASDEEYGVFLDTREKNEFDISQIKNARWVGYKNFKLDYLNGIDKDKKIIVYCSIGYRSEKIAEKLVKAGYTSVSNLYGGIFEWVNEGNSVYKISGEPTREVHAYNKFWSKWLREGKKVYN